MQRMREPGPLQGISRMLGGTLAKYGFPYSVDDFETLNHRRYLCPVCGSIDRDRLYKLYVDRFLRPTASGGCSNLRRRHPCRHTCAAAPTSSTARRI